MPVSFMFLRLPSPIPAVRVVAGEHAAPKPQQVFLIGLFLFLYVGAEVGFAGWIYTYETSLPLSDASTAAYLTSVFWGALTGSLAGCLVSLGLILANPSSFTAVGAGTICLGISMASIFPTTLSLAGRRMKLTPHVTGWFIVAASGGSMPIPLVIGQAFSAAGPHLVIVVTTSTLAIAFGVFAFMIRNLKLGSAYRINGKRTREEV